MVCSLPFLSTYLRVTVTSWEKALEGSQRKSCPSKNCFGEPYSYSFPPTVSVHDVMSSSKSVCVMTGVASLLRFSISDFRLMVIMDTLFGSLGLLVLYPSSL